jgi:hypothetical protein
LISRILTSNISPTVSPFLDQRLFPFWRPVISFRRRRLTITLWSIFGPMARPTGSVFHSKKKHQDVTGISEGVFTEANIDKFPDPARVAPLKCTIHFPY